jgi:hypothetical protein
MSKEFCKGQDQLITFCYLECVIHLGQVLEENQTGIKKEVGEMGNSGLRFLEYEESGIKELKVKVRYGLKGIWLS